MQRITPIILFLRAMLLTLCLSSYTKALRFTSHIKPLLYQQQQTLASTRSGHSSSFSNVPPFSAAQRCWPQQPHRRSSYVSMAMGASSFLDGSSVRQQLANKKFVVITGGVISGIGKGVTASSIGVLMKMMKQRPTAIKIDPYLNADAGTMSPFEHGEVFVLDDGGETDLDLGNYERFLDVRLSSDSNLTTGKIYQAVIAKERRGEYLGKTVQIIPHVTNEIIERIIAVASRPVDGSDSNSNSESNSKEQQQQQKEGGSTVRGEEPDVCVIELGGTIGDIESMPFVEALRQLQLMVPRENFCLVHVSMVPTVGPPPGEHKTKPTQHSVKELRSLGLAPDFIVCRSQQQVDFASREKIALFCNVRSDHVLSIYDVSNIYHVPTVMMQQQLHVLLSDRMQLRRSDSSSSSGNSNTGSTTSSSSSSDSSGLLDGEMKRGWQQMADQVDTAVDVARVALVGKYCGLSDSYLSVTSALKHACIATGQRLELILVDSSHLEAATQQQQPQLYESAWQQLRNADGVLVPGGFGVRGIEGKVAAVRYARESKVPFLGICLGMQAAVIEYARSVLLMPRANSAEFAAEVAGTADAAVVFMPEGDTLQLGGTMRLGARKTLLAEGSLAQRLYAQQSAVMERHRHRYEVNPLLVQALEQRGLRFSGRDESQQRMEIVELDQQQHPYFVAVQFHPEFKSRPLRPAPVFRGLLQAVKDRVQSTGSSSSIDSVASSAAVMQQQ